MQSHRVNFSSNAVLGRVVHRNVNGICSKNGARKANKGGRIVCQAAAAQSKPPDSQMLVYVPPHPLVKHWIAIARSSASPSPIFRSALAELGRLLIYEACREFLPTVDIPIQTPLGQAEGTIVDAQRPVKVVPILRAGLVLQEQASTVLPSSETYHIGAVRNDETLEASMYLNKLPEKFTQDDLIMVLDPMLATGGTMVMVLDEIVSRGANPRNIRVISIVAAPPALKIMSEKFPGMKVYTGIIDPEVNDKGFIIPGLGDAGDRAFGTA